MLRFALRRLLIAVPTLFAIITIAFFLIRIAPGGPFDLERPLEAKVMENLNRIYHLDEPLWRQYIYYLGNLARGDFGPSFVYRDFSVAQLFESGLPVSIQLGAGALLLALAIGTLLGSVAARASASRSGSRRRCARTAPPITAWSGSPRWASPSRPS